MHIAEPNTHRTHYQMWPRCTEACDWISPNWPKYFRYSRRPRRALVSAKFHIFSTQKCWGLFIFPQTITTKLNNWRQIFFGPFGMSSAPSRSFFAPFWCHLYLFGVEEIPFNVISHLFSTKTHHKKYQKIGRSFFGFLGILRCTRRQEKAFFAYFGVTCYSVTSFNLFQYSLHWYYCLTLWMSL